MGLTHLLTRVSFSHGLGREEEALSGLHLIVGAVSIGVAIDMAVGVSVRVGHDYDVAARGHTEEVP